jgi:Fe2+ or Zn2+ uptake regulation protein
MAVSFRPDCSSKYPWSALLLSVTNVTLACEESALHMSSGAWRAVLALGELTGRDPAASWRSGLAGSGAGNARAMPHTATDPTPLRRLGLRATAPRMAVLELLASVGGHHSADELVGVLREQGYPHARTTVYNALADLAHAGLVREAPVTAGALRYEAETAPHHHFVCRRCGLIINVPLRDELPLPPYPPHRRPGRCRGRRLPGPVRAVRQGGRRHPHRPQGPDRSARGGR